MEEKLMLLYKTVEEMRKWQEAYKMDRANHKAWIKKKQTEKQVDILLLQLHEYGEESNNKA